MKSGFPESGLFLEEPTLAPNGRALVYARWKGVASVCLLRLGPAEAAASRKRWTWNLEGWLLR